MSRVFKDIGEPIQLYMEVLNIGKTVSSSKKKVRWIIGFTKMPGEVEVVLIHSISSGKKTITEDGKRITEATGILKTDFGHTWKSETADARLFRVEITVGYSTDPFDYIFSVDGIRFNEMSKKNKANPYPGVSNDNNNNNDAANQRESMNKRASLNKPFSNNDLFDENNGTAVNNRASVNKRNSVNKETTPTVNKETNNGSRGNFQSPHNNDAATSFDFFETDQPNDPFASKPTNNRKSVSPANNAGFFDDDFQPTSNQTSNNFASFDSNIPFSSSNQTITPKKVDTSTTKSVTKTTPTSTSKLFSEPNFMDENTFTASDSTFEASFDKPKVPTKRASAADISMNFAGLSFDVAPPAPPAPVVEEKIVSAAIKESPEASSAQETNSVDPWAANLVNLDLTGKNTINAKNPSSTVKGPSLVSMMPNTGPSQSLANQPLKPMNAPPMPNNMGGRASFIAPMNNQGGMGMGVPMQGSMGAPMQGGMGMQNGMSMQNGMGMQNGMSMQNGMGMQNGMSMQNGMGMQNGMSMQNGMVMQNGMNMQNGMGMQNSMGAPMQGGMGMGGRASFIAPMNNQGNMGMGGGNMGMGGGNMGMQSSMSMGGPMQGNMGGNSRASFIGTPMNSTSTNYQQQNKAPTTSLDSINPFA